MKLSKNNTFNSDHDSNVLWTWLMYSWITIRAWNNAVRAGRAFQAADFPAESSSSWLSASRTLAATYELVSTAGWARLSMWHSLNRNILVYVQHSEGNRIWFSYSKPVLESILLERYHHEERHCGAEWSVPFLVIFPPQLYISYPFIAGWKERGQIET